MASAELAKVLEMIRENAERLAGGAQRGIAEMRSDFAANALPPTEAATIAAVDANGVPGEWITVAGSDPNRRLLYVHGGGYVIGSAATHRRLCEDIAAASGCSILNLDYRLAPEHPFPAAVDDAVAGLQFMQENGPDGPGAAESTFVAGDSAGGGLTLATLLAARERGAAMPNAAIGISAWTDMAVTGESISTRAEADPLITDKAIIKQMAAAYVGDGDAEDPLASPVYADYAGLPPLLLQVGDAEVLLDDTRRAAERARAAGVDVKEEVWDEMFHVWHAFAPMLPEGREAIARIGEFIRQHG